MHDGSPDLPQVSFVRRNCRDLPPSQVQTLLPMHGNPLLVRGGDKLALSLDHMTAGCANQFRQCFGIVSGVGCVILEDPHHLGLPLEDVVGSWRHGSSRSGRPPALSQGTVVRTR